MSQFAYFQLVATGCCAKVPDCCRQIAFQQQPHNLLSQPLKDMNVPEGEMNVLVYHKSTNWLLFWLSCFGELWTQSTASLITKSHDEIAISHNYVYMNRKGFAE
jgi:hypothetical protein